MKQDLDVIIAASLVHDIKKMSSNHAKKGARYIEKFMKKEKLMSHDQRSKIIEIIYNHDKKGGIRS